ncbi:MAG: hypothetical protein HQ564_07550 [Candidatus Saganbacteria bacterium]|nr:hypothetical protein [Candidatus Saganbacteria bacterium]
MQIARLRQQGQRFTVIHRIFKPEGLPKHFTALGGTGKTDTINYWGGGVPQVSLASILVSEKEDHIYSYQEQRAIELLQDMNFHASYGARLIEFDLTSGGIRIFFQKFGPTWSSKKEEFTITELEKRDINSSIDIYSCLDSTIRNPLTEKIRDELIGLQKTFFPTQFLAPWLDLPFNVTQTALDSEALKSSQKWEETFKRLTTAQPDTDGTAALSLQIDLLIINAMANLLGTDDKDVLRQYLTTPKFESAEERHSTKIVSWSEYWRSWAESCSWRETDIPIHELPLPTAD